MKEIRNLTQAPLRVPLGGGKVLHLGPAHRGQVSDDTVERAAFRKLVDSGAIEVLGQGHGESFAEEGPVLHEATQGHHPPSVVLPKGNR